MDIIKFVEDVVQDIKTQEEFRSRCYVIGGGVFMHFDYGSDEGSEKMQEVVLKTIFFLRVAGKFEGAALVGEAWMSTQKVQENKKYVRPVDDPERKEIVFYFAYDQNLTRTFKAWDIIRQGSKKDLKEFRADFGFKSGSSWLDKAFFPMPDPPPELKEMALRALENMKAGKKPKGNGA